MRISSGFKLLEEEIKWKKPQKRERDVLTSNQQKSRPTSTVKPLVCEVGRNLGTETEFRVSEREERERERSCNFIYMTMEMASISCEYARESGIERKRELEILRLEEVIFIAYRPLPTRSEKYSLN